LLPKKRPYVDSRGRALQASCLDALDVALLLSTKSPEDIVFRTKRLKLAATVIIATWVFSGTSLAAVDAVSVVAPRSIGELKRTAIIHLGKTADWVAITPDAVWIGSTGPFAVHKVDSRTNKRVATVHLPGAPCAGLATGFGSLWVPICGQTPTLAKVDLMSNKLISVLKIGPAAAEGGVTTSPDSVWLVVDKDGSLARIDPTTGTVRHTTRVPAGSYNPFYNDGQIWVTHADGSEVTSVDAATGMVLATVPTGPGPRFLTAGAGAVWTLNQGDGSLTRIDTRTKQATKTLALGIPGHGGDISFGNGMVWTTVWKVPLSVVDGATATLRCQWAGPGGDSLGIGHGAIWLTDYHAGTISRIELDDALARCNDRSRQ
jgi:virginiamycin B lyase